MNSLKNKYTKTKYLNVNEKILSDFLNIGSHLLDMYEQNLNPPNTISTLSDDLQILVHLYKITQENKFLQTAITVGKKLSNDKFKCGIKFAMLRQDCSKPLFTLLNLFELTRNQTLLNPLYLLECSEIDFPRKNYTQIELNFIKIKYLPIKLRLYSVTNDKLILSGINIDILNFIRNSQFTENGIKNDYLFTNPRLVAYESSNILLFRDIFHNLYTYFDNPAFSFISDQLDARNPYPEIVSYHFKSANTNTSTSLSIENINNELQAILRYNNDLLRQAFILENHNYPRLVNKLMKQIKTWKSMHYELALENMHNYLMAATYLKAFQYFRDELYFTKAINCLSEIKPLKSNNAEIIALNISSKVNDLLFSIIDSEKFNLTSVHNLNKSSSNKKKESEFPGIAIAVSDVRRKILESTFVKTISMLNHLNPTGLKEYLNISLASNKTEIRCFKTYVREIIRTKIDDENYIKKTFDLELEKRRIILKFELDASQRMKEFNSLVEMSFLLKNDEKLFKNKITVSENFHLYYIRQHSILKVRDFTFNNYDYDFSSISNPSILLKYNIFSAKCEEMRIDRIDKIILTIYASEDNFEKALLKIINRLEFKPQDEDYVKKLITSKVKHFLKFRILTVD